MLGAAAICLCVAAPVTAATFSFENGDVIEGEIINATRNTVVIREKVGGMQQLSRRKLKSVRVKTKRGKVISGSLVGWQNGLYKIESAGQLIQVRDRRIVAVAPIQSQQTAVAAQTNAEAEPEAIATQGDVQETDTARTASAAIVPLKKPVDLALSAVSIIKPRPKPGSDMTPVFDEPEPLNPALVKTALVTAPDPMPARSVSPGNEDSRTPPILSITPVEADEDATEIVFELSLSRPVSQPIMILYATYDKTAVAGEDYKGGRGVMKLAPGTSSALVRVPLIDDGVLEEDETLELFVSADKSRATVESDRTLGTILNDDK